ncbi:MAG TPA: hypothetical protein VEK75_10235 [Xanthobacteraceae bacterium]|nr:hypothetical protein [Xanthobacteraceae bacterium]
MIHRIKIAIASSIAAKSKAIASLLRLRRIRSANGPSALGQRKKEAHQRLEELERWSARATLLILFGIVVDIATVLYVPHERAEIIGALIANGLIGVGLIIEYIVILRAITASGEAQREADERVGIAEKQASEANARAAEAELKTEMLRAELAWRRISREEAAKMTEVLGRADLPKFGLRIFHVSGDPEALTFSQDIADVFRRNGWPVLFVATSQTLSPGVMIPLYAAPHLEACGVTRMAFQNASINFVGGFPVDSGGMMMASGDDIPGPAAAIYVGSRLPPKLSPPAATQTTAANP